MMKYSFHSILFLVFIICSLGCYPDLKQDQQWRILQITHQGKNITPHSVASEIHLEVVPVGAEGTEAIKFDFNTGYVDLPGFNSYRLSAEFRHEKDVLRIFDRGDDNASEAQYDLTKRIFYQDFEMTVSGYNGAQIDLISDSTFIRIKSNNQFVQERIDHLFGR